VDDLSGSGVPILELGSNVRNPEVTGGLVEVLELGLISTLDSSLELGLELLT
jgi:hypothetical protein